MTSFSRTAFLLILCLLAPGISQAQRNEVEARKFGWHSNYQEARSIAKKTGKPLMVVFRCIP